MTMFDGARFWAELDRMGEAEVRKTLALNIWHSEKDGMARHWLAYYESSRASSDSAAIIEEAQSANSIAREAAESARLSADEAHKSRIIATVALAAAIIAATASIIGAVHSFYGDTHDGEIEKTTKTH